MPSHFSRFSSPSGKHVKLAKCIVLARLSRGNGVKFLFRFPVNNGNFTTETKLSFLLCVHFHCAKVNLKSKMADVVEIHETQDDFAADEEGDRKFNYKFLYKVL